jgi:hypothetical protein
LPTRFRHKGSAYGAAGTLTIPFREIIPIQASSHLADIGGYGTAHSENFAHRNILRFDRAHTEVTGSQTHPEGPTYSTLVKSTVEGLDIMGMVTADRVVANLVSTYVHGPNAEAAINLIGSRFENLKIAGIPVKVCLNLDVLEKYPRHKDLKDAYKTEKKVRDLFGDDDLRNRHPTAPKEVKDFLDAPPPGKKGEEMPHFEGFSLLSIIRKLEPECNAFETFGHVIYIVGFGTIRLGEVRICKKTRHLSMIQVKLGCPVEGDLSVSAVDDGPSMGN